MEMEIEIVTYTAPPTPKRLHAHVMPIVIIAIAVMVVSVPFVLRQSTVGGSGATLMHDLSTRPLKVNPTTKGYARVTLNHSNAGNYVSPEVSQAGQTSSLLLQLHDPKL